MCFRVGLQRTAHVSDCEGFALGGVVLPLSLSSGDALLLFSNTTCLTHVFFKSGKECNKFN